MNKSEKHGVRGSEGRDGGIGRGHDGSKPTESIEQEWEKELQKVIGGWDIVYLTTGYDDLVAFIHKVRQEAYKSGVKDTVETIKLCAKEQSCSLCKEHLSNLSLESKEQHN
jgi:hypothetical protein